MRVSFVWGDLRLSLSTDMRKDDPVYHVGSFLELSLLLHLKKYGIIVSLYSPGFVRIWYSVTAIVR